LAGVALGAENERAAIQIVILDGHDLFRMGLARYLEREPDLHVLAHAGSGPAGLRLMRNLHPNVVVLDQDLPGVRVADVVTEVGGEPRVVVLDASTTPAAVTEALTTGASSYLGKDSDVDDIAAAIRAAAAGNTWLSAAASQVVTARLRDAPPLALSSPVTGRLSARELEVLRLLARGLDNAEIAASLAITPSTAKNHVSSILTKLEVPNRILAAIYAVRHELA